MSERRYNEEEVAEIVRLASVGKTESSTPSHGMSLADIQTMAAEFGLDPTAIQSAANQLEEGLPETHFTWSQAEFMKTIDGELNETGWEEIVVNMRRRAGHAGEVVVRGQTREWNAKVGDSELYHLSATTRGGKTRIRLTHDISTYYLLTWIFSSLGALFGSGFIISGIKNGAESVTPFIIGSIMMLIAMFSAIGLTKAKRNKSRALGEILDECAEIIVSKKGQVTTPVAASDEELRVQLNQGDSID